MHGLYLLWWVEEKSVPAAIAAAILATGDLAITLLEVPTGWFADRCGHRISLIAGSAIQIAGMLFLWLGQGVAGLFLGTLLIALGDAFRSGADHALLYRSCVALGREPDFQKIEAKTHAAGLVALVCLVLAGGAIVDAFGYAVGWLTETTVSVAGLMLAAAMTEPPLPELTSDQSTVRQSATASFRSRGWQMRMLTALLVPASLLGGLASAALFLAQTTRGTAPARMTLVVAIVTCAEAAGSALATSWRGLARSQIMLAGIGTSFAAAAFVLPALFTPAVVALSFLVGVAIPMRAAAVQRFAADRMRARAASLASASDKAFTFVALIVAGLLPRNQ